MSNAERIEKWAVDATARFLSRKGYEILEEPPDTEFAQIVAKEGETVVFVSVTARLGTDEGLPREELDREDAEATAIAWLVANPGAVNNCNMRFDSVAILALGNGKAFLRHHINALGEM